MSLIAMGCDPTAKGDSNADIGNVPLGTLAYSPDGGMYIAIRAAGAVGQYRACKMEGDFDIDEVGTADLVGLPICVPQVALADNDYGWALVFGRGFGDAGNSVSAGGQVSISGTDGEIDDGTSNNLGNITFVKSRTGAGAVEIYVQFPFILS